MAYLNKVNVKVNKDAEFFDLHFSKEVESETKAVRTLLTNLKLMSSGALGYFGAHISN